MPYWIQFILSTVGVVGLILLLFYAMKKLNKSVSVVNGNKLRILDRANLGRDSMLLVVTVCGKVMLIGVSAGRVEKLCDLNITEDEYLSSAEAAPKNFADILSGFMFKKKSDDNKNDEIEKTDKTNKSD